MRNTSFYIVLTGLFLAFVLMPTELEASVAGNEDGRFVVTIDPGHGGRDLGTSGQRLHEKNVNLKVATKLQRLLETNHSDSVRVVLTRSTDKALTLNERADIANEANADLFVSIHVNSVKEGVPGRKNVNGTSVFVLGLHRSTQNLEVAMSENSVIELEDDYSERYQGFDPNSAESYIIFELSQNANLNQSLEMAQFAQNYLVNHAGRRNREVRQGGFLVLWATTMPAVLVELDYMCNPRVEEYLSSDANLDKLAEALYFAVNDYRRLHPRHTEQSHNITNNHTIIE